MTTSKKQRFESMDPVRKQKPRLSRVVCRLEAPLKEEVQRRAKKMGCSGNSLIAHALVEFLKRRAA